MTHSFNSFQKHSIHPTYMYSSWQNYSYTYTFFTFSISFKNWTIIWAQEDRTLKFICKGIYNSDLQKKLTCLIIIKLLLTQKWHWQNYSYTQEKKHQNNLNNQQNDLCSLSQKAIASYKSQQDSHTSVRILFYSSTETSSNCCSVLAANDQVDIKFCPQILDWIRSGHLEDQPRPEILLSFQPCSHRFTFMLVIVILLERELMSQRKIYIANFDYHLILWYKF